MYTINTINYVTRILWLEERWKPINNETLIFITCTTYQEWNISNRMLFYTQILLKTVKTAILIVGFYCFIYRLAPDPSRSYTAKSASVMLRSGPNGGLTSQMVLKTSQKHKTQQSKNYYFHRNVMKIFTSSCNALVMLKIELHNKTILHTLL